MVNSLTALRSTCGKPPMTMLHTSTLSSRFVRLADPRLSESSWPKTCATDERQSLLHFQFSVAEPHRTSPRANPGRARACQPRPLKRACQPRRLMNQRNVSFFTSSVKQEIPSLFQQILNYLVVAAKSGQFLLVFLKSKLFYVFFQ